MLSRVFYDSLLHDPQASILLSSDEVESRLSKSLERWVTEILTFDPKDDITPLLLHQRHVGIMHSRVNVTIELVLRGARLIKCALLGALLHGPEVSPVNVEAARLATSVIDLAIEAMSAAYSSSREKAARTDEAFRSYAATVNVTLEREKQRAALSDWSNRLLQNLMMGTDDISLGRIGQSPFGFWIRHKAPALFGNATELDEISFRMDRIDRTMLPACQREINGSAEELRKLTRNIVGEVEDIRSLTETMFDHLVHMESGRDAQTQLLNRRFLPAVLSREVELSRDSQEQFSVLMIDVDHFKRFNDHYGHPAGDQCLKRVAAALQAHVGRAGELVGRYGGEEFAVLLPLCDAAAALDRAQRMCEAVRELRIPHAASTHAHWVTISVGVAWLKPEEITVDRVRAHHEMPDGGVDWPPLRSLFEQADVALYQAKRRGRDRAVLYGVVDSTVA